jgi:hypothetical protein
VTRRVAYQDINCPPEISYGEDAYICWQALKRVNRLGFIDASFYHYRMNDASISHRPVGKSKLSSRILWNYIVNEVSLLYPQYVTLAKGQRGRNSLMLLFEVALYDTKHKENILTLKHDVKEDYGAMKDAELLEFNKLMFARMLIINWQFAAWIIRIIYKNKTL